ncbi:MAG: AAA family ATPase [Planctomycetes bacterium]|nr:AAA family ATPase [Planctomycetota bacterium]
MIEDLVPVAPAFALDWERIRALSPWVDALHHCEQDVTYHAEGDVGIHTRMACEALLADPSWRALEERERRVTFLAVLLHDVAKPICTRRTEEGRLTARGHSKRGENLARRILFEEGFPFDEREQVVALVRLHQVPFFAIEEEDAVRRVLRASHVARCDLLTVVARADGAGRTCADARDQQRILDNTELFLELARQEGCADRAYAFSSEHARFTFFRDGAARHPRPVFDDRRGEVFVMSGLPGMGKDTWLARHAPDRPVISLDVLRRELRVDPRNSQGSVLQAARERARGFLREGRPFCWNATLVTRELRTQLVDFLAGYRARVHIVYVEVDEPTWRRRNAERRERVPDAVLEKLLGKWSVPDRTEAHAVTYAVEGVERRSR